MRLIKKLSRKIINLSLNNNQFIKKQKIIKQKDKVFKAKSK